MSDEAIEIEKVFLRKESDDWVVRLITRSDLDPRRTTCFFPCNQSAGERLVATIEFLVARIAELEAAIEAQTMCVEVMGDKLAELEEAQRWIPVTERLPEFGEEVLLYWPSPNRMESGSIHDGSEFGGDWYHVFYDGDSMRDQPTHWKPITPPNER